MINNANYVLYMHDYILTTNAKISLDKIPRTRYDELIKSEMGN